MDNWLTSILLLEEAIGVPLVNFAAQLATRFKAGAAFTAHAAAAMETYSCHGLGGTGGAKRSPPVGGSAYGMPKNNADMPSVNPCTGP